MGFFSQYYFRVRFPRAFTKYNYLFAGGASRESCQIACIGRAADLGKCDCGYIAMDGGTQTCIFVLSFAVQGASGVAHPFPYWWGNVS